MMWHSSGPLSMNSISLNEGALLGMIADRLHGNIWDMLEMEMKATEQATKNK